MLKKICFTLNGKKTGLEAEGSLTLLDALRNRLHLTGTKCGCEKGECGACTVIINGRAVNSCLYPLYKLQGAEIWTVEGLAAGGELHLIQQAFLDKGAIQCGFCTPGMLMSAKALLDENPSPGRAEILKGMGGNICRCTGYVKIIEAIELAADRLRAAGGISGPAAEAGQAQTPAAAAQTLAAPVSATATQAVPAAEPASAKASAAQLQSSAAQTPAAPASATAAAGSGAPPPLSHSHLYVQQAGGPPLEKALPPCRKEPGKSAAPAGGPGGGYMGLPLWDGDGYAKATGSPGFAADLSFPGMLYGAQVWAGRPHAKILKLDTAAAKAAPGVAAVITGGDVPGKNGYGLLSPDQPVFCTDEVRFVRDSVALVVAETEAQARAAALLVRVEYEDLPPVYSMREAAEKGQIIKELTHLTGDPDAARREPDILIVKGHFTTPAVEHAYLEPEASVGLWSDTDGLTLYAPTQSPFELRRQLTAILNLPADKVRVVATPVGGGFGSKADPTIEPAVAVAAYCLKRPVKAVFTREESMGVSTKRHPYDMDYEIGLSRDGILRYADIRLLSDGGPYANLSPRVIDQACIFSIGPYRIEHARVEGRAVATNNIPSSAFRGFGINQSNFCMESLLDEAAEKLGIDPFELRLRNAFREGDHTLSGEILQKSVGIRDTLLLCRDAAYKALEKYQGLYPQGTKKLGMGMASGFKNVGAGKGKIDDAGATVVLETGGGLTLYVSGVDMGQGFRTAMGQLAAEVLGCAPEAVTVINGDTKLTVPHSNAVGERQTLISGSAVVGAAKEFRQRLAAVLAGNTEGLPKRDEADTMRNQSGANAGIPVPGGDKSLDPDDTSYKQLPSACPENLAKALAVLETEKDLTLKGSYVYIAPKTFALYDTEGRAGVSKEDYKNYPAYAYTTQAAIVEADTATGKVRVLEAIAAHDVGRLINPNVVDGQLSGSCAMSIGYALSEAFPMAEGRPLVKHYGQLGMPTFGETPLYDIRIVEDPEPHGPLGAKGVSEVATVPMTPAVINAVYHATGRRIKDLPATPEKILADG